MNISTSSEEELSIETSNNYRRIRNVKEYSDDGSLENADELSVRRARNRRGNYCKISLDKKEILIKCYEDGSGTVYSAEIAGINKNTAKSIMRRLFHTS